MDRRILYRLAVLCAAVLAVTTVGWAKTFHMTSTDIVPAAAADVNVAKEKNGDIRFNVKAEHLAKPGRLTPPANSYIVWLQEGGSDPQSQGELKIGNDLKGELKATTPLNNFKVFVTAETDGQTKTPSDQVVLRATVQQ